MEINPIGDSMETGKQAFDAGASRWQTQRTPGGMVVHTNGRYRIETYRAPSFRSHVASGYSALSVSLYVDGELLSSEVSVRAAKDRAARHAATLAEGLSSGHPDAEGGASVFRVSS